MYSWAKTPKSPKNPKPNPYNSGAEIQKGSSVTYAKKRKKKIKGTFQRGAHQKHAASWKKQRMKMLVYK